MEREVKERSVGGEQAVDWDEEETCGAPNGRKMERVNRKYERKTNNFILKIISLKLLISFPFLLKSKLSESTSTNAKCSIYCNHHVHL